MYLNLRSKFMNYLVLKFTYIPLDNNSVFTYFMPYYPPIIHLFPTYNNAGTRRHPAYIFNYFPGNEQICTYEPE